MNRRVLGTLAAVLLTAASLWWLVATDQLAPVLAGLGAADLRILALVLPLVVVLQFARAGRFVLLLERMRQGGLMASFRISCVHIALNFLLPFKLGEAAFPLLARRLMGVELAAGTSTLLTVRILDLGTLFAFLAVSASFAVPSLASWRWLSLLAAAAALLAPLALLVGARFVQRRIPVLASIGEVLARAQARHIFGQVTLLSLLVWACHAGVAWLAFAALGQPVDLATAVFAGACANLAFALPFQGIAGLGPVQAAFAWAAVQAGVPTREAITVALATHAALLLSGCLLGLLAMLSEPGLRWWRAPPTGSRPG
ncbi:lysylphosphatidylglycerol synthase transmembrane domain-containing protein [Geminicoccus roseus]|uniref:lysylphosphatidylglycerol synthase transmembrane domain-containing protein n=1 Tax=Geminicoccus roseus TaxID=404900 RepID=UPI0004242978|nr:lysylphosphatidylglycerol synthase transmembrane domain-containing protein [Geminicoccus roseus]